MGFILTLVAYLFLLSEVISENLLCKSLVSSFLNRHEPGVQRTDNYKLKFSFTATASPYPIKAAHMWTLRSQVSKSQSAAEPQPASPCGKQWAGCKVILICLIRIKTSFHLGSGTLEIIWKKGNKKTLHMLFLGLAHWSICWVWHYFYTKWLRWVSVVA